MERNKSKLLSAMNLNVDDKEYEYSINKLVFDYLANDCINSYFRSEPLLDPAEVMSLGEKHYKGTCSIGGKQMSNLSKESLERMSERLIAMSRDRYIEDNMLFSSIDDKQAYSLKRGVL